MQPDELHIFANNNIRTEVNIVQAILCWSLLKHYISELQI